MRFSKDPLIEQLLSTVHTITSKRAAGHLKSRENIVRSQHEISPSIMNDKDQSGKVITSFGHLTCFFKVQFAYFFLSDSRRVLDYWCFDDLLSFLTKIGLNGQIEMVG